ncbi:DUF349 domain-containing protein [Alkalimonas amylolytica]|uniref:DUF349 domain-containing protein n=1 Tax=Alkalimonas amylolytica TaxID=152573 RepID=A0A1H3ZA67_ALKAM|nr:DUF349 domain-containing protein [Alkalimonas amylolytica]SEA20577.1 protein of unknown function [Alkalimonas amylolytica]
MMIFKRLLRPKWQHPDSEKRIAAIHELNEQQSDYKHILHELAFNDGSTRVRQTALQKLNDFSLWWQASKKEASERLRLEAESRVVEMVIANQIPLRLKQQFIEQCQRSSVLEQILRQEQDSSIKLSLLERLDKQELYLEALQDDQLALSTRQDLLARIQDDKELERLPKRLPAQLAEQASQLVLARQQQRERPARLRKQASLILSKMNALKERAPADSEQRYIRYQQEWIALEHELSQLDDGATLQAKFQQLTASVENFFARSWQQARQQQAEQDRLQQQQLQLVGLRKAITALEIDLQQSLMQTNLQQAEQLNAQFQALQQQLQQADLAATDQALLHAELVKLEQQLIDLPRVALRFGQAEQLLQQWQTELIPEQASELAGAKARLQQWQHSWQHLSADLSLAVPATLKESYMALQQRWQNAIKELERELQQPFRQCRSKLHEFKRLHQAGKFNLLFGLFKGIEHSYQQLLPEQQQQLDSLYQQAKHQLDELSDLQAFIARPRKEALLQQMQQLVQEPMHSASERSALVKKARADWLSLGKTAEDAGQDWQQQFDAACEQAFAPCREFFARQQAEREQHAADKQALLDTYSVQLVDDSQEVLSAALHQLQQQWQAIGPVPKEQHESLQQSYQQLCQQLRQRVKQQQAAFAQQKQQLVEQVKAAIELSDTHQAAAILKQCQQSWKQIPFAGKAQDAVLWQEFRTLCDDFFARRKLEYQQAQQEREQQQLALQQALSACDQALQDTTQLQQLSSLRSQLLALDLSGFSSLQRSRQQLMAQLEQKQHSQIASEQQQSYQQLFAALNAAAEPAQLPALWRDAWLNQPDGMSRVELTMVLELMVSGQVQDPTAKPEQISALKLQLLAEKHNQANSLSKDALLTRWLSHGPLQSHEAALLQRVSALFV